MTDSRAALLVLLGSMLFVVSCATWLEPPVAPPRRADLEARVAKVEAPLPRAAEPSPALLIPVRGVAREALRDSFEERRGVRRHRAIDIMARRGTPVVAAGAGPIAKIHRHALAGLCVYQYDDSGEYVYFYAHLDGYAPGLKEGLWLARGAPVGFVGSTGNAPKHAPHLHFALLRRDDGGKWYKGIPVNPYPHLVEPAT